VPYGWPLRPFNRQHPVRAFLNDPRIEGSSRAFHFGIDISAPDGTAVYAIEAGTVSFNDPTAFAVVSPGGRIFGYWHVNPAVRNGQHVAAHQLLGHVAQGWGHVHLAERPRRGASYVDPLRPGALTPFVKHTHPLITGLAFERGGKRVPVARVTGLVNVVAEAHDQTPLAVPAPWHAMPVSPARLRWRVLRGDAMVKPWKVGMNLSLWRDAAAFHLLYAPGTRQNHPSKPGLYRYFLAHEWATGTLPDGAYRLQIEAADKHGNVSRATFPFVIGNHAPPV
jgi:Peptidase family M23